MSEAGPSSANRRISTGEFTDDENLDIPLRDIREAEFERLEAGPITETVEDEKQQSSRWFLWPLNKRRRSSAGYTKVDNDDAASPLATNGLKQKQKKASGWLCGGKLVWGILYVCPSFMFN